MKKFLIILICICIGNKNASASVNEHKVKFDFDWKFSKGDFPDAAKKNLTTANGYRLMFLMIGAFWIHFQKIILPEAQGDLHPAALGGTENIST